MEKNQGNKNIVTYQNDENIKKAKKNKKITFKSLYNKCSGLAGVVTGIVASNKFALFLGGMTQDLFIKNIGIKIGELQGFLKWADYTKLQGIYANFKIMALEKFSLAVSFLWNMAAANPVLAGVVVATLAAGGAYLVSRVPLLIAKVFKKKGKVKSLESGKSL